MVDIDLIQNFYLRFFLNNGFEYLVMGTVVGKIFKMTLGSIQLTDHSKEVSDGYWISPFYFHTKMDYHDGLEHLAGIKKSSQYNLKNKILNLYIFHIFLLHILLYFTSILCKLCILFSLVNFAGY